MKLKLIIATMALITSTAFAQEWPQKTVKVVVPLGAGSSLDYITRIVFDQVSKQTGKPFVIENKTGASGTIASGGVAKSSPDGYTLLVNTWTHTIVPSAFKNLSYSVENDFTNISGVITQPFVFVTKTKWNSLGDMVKYGQQNPSKLMYATSGVGSGAHLCMEKFAHEANVKMTDVPYRSTTEPITNIMGGEIDVFCTTFTQAAPLDKDNRINLVSILAPKRSPMLPDVPTMKELGYGNVNVHYWIGVFGPAKMDPLVVARINTEVQRAMEDTQVKARLWVSGSDPIKMDPKQFDSFVKQQIKHNAEIVTRSKITME